MAALAYVRPMVTVRDCTDGRSRSKLTVEATRQARRVYSSCIDQLSGRFPSCLPGPPRGGRARNSHQPLNNVRRARGQLGNASRSANRSLVPEARPQLAGSRVAIRSVASAATQHAQTSPHLAGGQTYKPLGRRDAADRMWVRGGSKAPPTGGIAFTPCSGV
jgi:hypothetical protein